MTDFFEHTPQTTDEVNQVENLASEVTDAFNKLDDIIYQDDTANASINSSIGDLDNKYIKEYVPNKGLIDNYTQTLYFPNNSQSATLDLYPSLLTEDLNNVSLHDITEPSVTYKYKHSGILESDTDFCFVNRKLILGQPPSLSSSLQITYKGFNTTSNDDTDEWPFELKYNILQIKQYDNTIVNSFVVEKEDTIYTVEGFNFKELCSTHIQNIINNRPHDLDKYVAVYSDDVRLEASQYEINENFFRFYCEEDITSEIKIYVANASLGKLIECLYRLFYTHDHGINGGQGVDHSSLLGLYTNTPEIQYQSTNKTNYDHPQYLNREGYVNDISVYNNAFLGDLFLASTSDSNRRNTLDANSVKLVFGEYNSGPRFYYDSEDECLWLDSISRDGIKLVTPRDKKALSINDHSFVDTKYETTETSKALKLALKTDTDQELGVFQLTRKYNAGSTTREDNKALLLSYGAEFSLVKVTENLVMDNGSKITFGDPSVIELVLKDDGLHFLTEAEGVLTESTSVNFDIPVKADNITVKHLDAKELHLTEDQKIVFGDTNHETEKTQYMNYSGNKLNIKTNSSVNVANNGRRIGLTLDNRQYIYASTPQGFPITDSVEYTDLYFETKRDVYFINSDYTFTSGVTNLQNVPKANTYSNINYVNNVNINYDSSVKNGINLNTNNSIFAQRDLTDNVATILQSNAGVVVASSYNTTGPVINYGKITAKTFYSEGNQDSDAGFYGNVYIGNNNKLTINGLTLFNSDITFNKGVTFTDKMQANTIDANTVNTNNLNVSDKATYNNVEVLEELRFNTLLQTNRTANSQFDGTVQFNNNVYIPNSNTNMVLGNGDIEDDRTVSGLLLNNREVKLGVGGLVSSGKYLAGKGTPSGNGDTIGGYAFASTTGQPDGDTGFFAEGSIEEQNNSDLVFRIDGVEKLRITKEDVDVNALDLIGKEKVVVTLDMLTSQVSGIATATLEKVYPIGTIYQNSVDGRNPKLILNWSESTWRRYAVGRSIIGAQGSEQSEKVDADLMLPNGLNLSVSGSKYGSYQHTLSIAEMPAHNHSIGAVYHNHGKDGRWASDAAFADGDVTNTGTRVPNNAATLLQNTGGSAAHNNTHPVIVTHIWERIA